MDKDANNNMGTNPENTSISGNNIAEDDCQSIGRDVNNSLRKKHKKSMTNTIKIFGEKIINVFKDYPVTLISVVLASLIGTFLVDYEKEKAFISELNLERAIAFLLILSVQCLFIEEVLSSKKLFRFVGYGFSACISAVYVSILSSESDTIFGVDAERLDAWLVRILVFYLITLVCLAIRHMYLRLEENFEAYASKAFLELIKSTVVYGLFAIGLGIIIFIFNELLFDTDEFIWKVELFLAGGIYAPMCIKAVARKNEEPGKFARVCFLYVLQPMLLIAFVIIYLYIFKLVFTGAILSNSIYAILAFLFSVGMPVWTVVHSMRQKEGFLSKTSLFLPYVFIPFLILQIWAISIRISDYGVTVDRYWAIILIIFEAIYFALYFLNHRGNKKAISYILYAVIIFSFLTLLAPVVNYQSVVANSQIKRMKEMLKDPEKYGSELRSAYWAVYRIGFDADDVLAENFTKEEINIMEKATDYGSHDTVYINDSIGNYGYVDISGYSKMRRLDTYGDYEEVNGRIYLYYSRSGNDEKLDVTDYIRDIEYEYDRKNHNNFDLSQNNIITVDNNTVIYLTYLSLSYDESDLEVSYISVNGYVLYK